MTNSILLTDKVLVVTGGAGGIGSCTLKLAVARGAKVVVSDLKQERAENLAHEICASGGEAIAVQADLAREADIQALVKTTIDHYGRIDILNNNAAAIAPEINARDINIENMPTEIWDQIYAVNIRGSMLLTRECLPHLVAQRGNIVNTVSNLALQGHVIQVAYSSSKAALIQMTRSVATSHGRQGVRCNAVAPGMTMTQGLREAFPPSILQAVEDETPRDQLGEPDDISEVVVWLASDAARNVTGQVIVADGGFASHVPGFTPFSTMISQRD
jgi:NAD(P)-dependent dehydrogenase (short-subunit alcohol dehydrogenase family)